MPAGDGIYAKDRMSTKDGMSIKDGLLRLRSALSVPKTSVRLTGLSGVGKTRLVQALFDERIGEQALNGFQVFYADMSDSPDPDPKAFAEQLIAGRERAILIVDNCPPDLHRRLTQACSESHSAVSLLTIEYDVRDDIPEETRVFRLEPASEEVIEKLIRKRFSDIGQMNAQTIARFAGGNARIAIALANTVRRGETLSGFRDEQLFERLFWQRHNQNDGLLDSAAVCSLVYSFEGTDASSETSELKLLASLIGKLGPVLYRDVKALKDRDLIQSRDVWRAVLPHAIANRLAKRALEAIPKDTIVQTFLNSGSERLMKSFARRLGYLHDCDTAREIANEWLAPEGWIGEATGNFNAFGMEVFKNIAPVSPEKALEAIERAANGNEGKQFTSRENARFYDFVLILHHLAYDPVLFDRSVRLMCRYALSEEPGEKSRSIRDVLKPLFYIIGSGTHASVEARAKVVEELMVSKEQDDQKLGFLLLDTALKTRFFDSPHNIAFGARPRDFGYQPKTQEEVVRWYETFINICTHLALSAQPIAKQARKILADNLRGLWTDAHMFEALEISAKQLQEQESWNEGWIAVRSIIRYDNKKKSEEKISERLRYLENLLRPDDLLQKARTYALLGSPAPFELRDEIGTIEDVSSAALRVEEITREIGAQVAQDIDTLVVLLPELVSTDNDRLYSFGRGLADGCGDKQELWQILCAQFQKTSPEKRSIRVLLGFLASCAESDPASYHSTLDTLISDDVLGEWFPYLQTASTIDQRGLERLNKALDTGKASIHTFKSLAWGRAHESISDDGLAHLLRKILSREGGMGVVIEILKMRFHRPGEAAVYSSSLLAVARDVMSTYPFSNGRDRNGSLDYDLARIAEICLKGEEGKGAAEATCGHLAEAIANSSVSALGYPDLLKNLAHAQPFVFLDAFLENSRINNGQDRRMFSDDSFEERNSPINQISDTDLLSWCESDPENRYPFIASAIQPFSGSTETGDLAWKPIVYSIFEKAPNLAIILECFVDATKLVSSWWGSFAEILQKRSVLFQALYQHDNAAIRDWARKQYQDLQEIIKREQEAERSRNRKINESFE